MAMKLPKILCGIAMGVSGFLALIFALDLIIEFPLGRSSWPTDVVVLIAAGLIIWFSFETWREL
jgi:hypothetical protein